MRDHGQTHAAGNLEELRLAIQRKVLQLFLGINRLPNLFLGQRFCVRVPARSKIAAASLEVPLLLTRPRHF